MQITNQSRIFRLIVGSVALLFAGIIYAWSILKAPLSTEFGWTSSQLGLNYSLTISMFCIGGMISGILSKKFSANLRTLAGAIMVFAGFFITSQLSGESIIPLLLGYAILAGLGIGIVYNAITAATAAWFPDNKGLCSGVLFMAFGFSTLVLGKVAGNLIDTPDFGWRNTFLALGIAIGAVLLVAALLLKMPPKDAVFPQGKSKANAKQAFEAMDITGIEMVKRPTFIKMFIFFILLCAVGSTAISFAKDISLEVGAGESLAVTIVGLLSVSNGLGRVVSGFVFDKYGMKFAQILMSAIVISASAITLAGVALNNLLLGVIGLCLCGLSYGFAPTMSASMIAGFYGSKNFALNLSLINLQLFPASFSATLAGAILTQFGSFTIIFAALTGFSLLGLLINMSIKRP